VSLTGRDLPDDGVPLAALRARATSPRRAPAPRARDAAARARLAAAVAAEYRAGTSVIDIASDFRTSDTTVYNLLRAARCPRTGYHR
jgi:hypothetical protein